MVKGIMSKHGNLLIILAVGGVCLVSILFTDLSNSKNLMIQRIHKVKQNTLGYLRNHNSAGYNITQILTKFILATTKIQHLTVGKPRIAQNSGKGEDVLNQTRSSIVTTTIISPAGSTGKNYFYKQSYTLYKRMAKKYMYVYIYIYIYIYILHI